MRHYVQFLDFDITGAYLLTFMSNSPTEWLYVHSTPWFDLDQQGGREHVVKNIFGIMAQALGTS